MAEIPGINLPPTSSLDPDEVARQIRRGDLFGTPDTARHRDAFGRPLGPPPSASNAKPQSVPTAKDKDTLPKSEKETKSETNGHDDDHEFITLSDEVRLPPTKVR